MAQQPENITKFLAQANEAAKVIRETAEKDVDMTWDELLEASRSAGWGEIWQELGLIGKDKEDNDNPEGGPENKGKPENHPGKGKGLDKKP